MTEMGRKAAVPDGKAAYSAREPDGPCAAEERPAAQIVYYIPLRSGNRLRRRTALRAAALVFFAVCRDVLNGCSLPLCVQGRAAMTVHAFGGIQKDPAAHQAPQGLSLV